MLRSWLASHRSLIATATSGFTVVTIVAISAFVSSGYTAQRMDLNDSAVWVANNAEQFVGRANTQVFELNTVVESASETMEVVQSGSTVLVLDSADAKLDVIDPATSELVESVALPPNQPSVYLAGDNVVIYSQGTGELWILPVVDVSNFDAGQVPDLNLGAQTTVSVDAAGLLFAFSPETGQVYRVDAAVDSIVRETVETGFAEDTDQSSADTFSITSVAGNWAVLNSTSGVLETASGRTPMADALGNGLVPVLQQPSLAGDSVLVGHSAGLLEVPFGGEAQALSTGRNGIPAAPSTVGGCDFAAWSDGSAWRRCAGDPTEGASAQGELLELEGMPLSPELGFRANGERLVLNDSAAGASWAVQSHGELIDNWDELIAVKNDEENVEADDTSTPPKIEQVQVPPVAVNDEFGARPGRATVVPVLLNDYDANNDVLIISSVRGLDPAIGQLDIIGEAQQVQLTLSPSAQGTLAFDYSISDGRGGTASATVAVVVRATTENSPPVQVRETSADVASPGTVSVQVLGDWIDPDGDAIYLASATAQAPDEVSSKPNGQIVYSDKGAGGSSKAVALVISDGTAVGFGTLSLSVRAAGSVPLIADPFVVLAYAGVEVRVAPLEHVRGGNAAIRLNSIPPRNGVTVTANYERGTFRLTSDSIGTHYLDYVVTDGVQTVTGVIRVDVAAPPDSSTMPITIPKTVFVQTLSSETVDVASSDIDPAGGVLLVTGVMNIPGGSGVRAEVIEQRAVRVSLLDLLTAPVTFNYRISNGLAEADGSITVIQVPSPTQLQPPIARDDTATVRVGDAITIDVMANDEHPDGEAISLDPVLVDGLSENSGLLFAAGNTLRYLAPERTGNFTATYLIRGPFGQTAQAQLRIQVREPDLDTNHAPVPTGIVARVLAGEQVRIAVPLDGIDPDGDSVQLLGQETNPEKGAVVEVGADYILYEAGQYSAGTDTFTYTLIDALGARVTGTIRVGISPRLDGARNPVAIEDEVRARPGATILVQVLANDSDPDGDVLTVVSATANDSRVSAGIIDGEIVAVTVPTAVDSYGVTYTIRNSSGGSSSNFVRVIVSNDAPLAYPVATDTVLTLSDILGRDTVDVDVLSRVFFADGDAAALGVSVLPSYSSAQVRPDKSIRVTVEPESQIIPFAVSHPDDDSVRSFAFIWVPGTNDALPQLDRRAPRLQVTSEETVVIDLNEYVIAVAGRQVRLTDSSTVTATHSDGSALVIDADTLRYTSADLYFGPASISFEVTDGSSAEDPNGRKATLVLPISVSPRENQPPGFTGAVIDFEPGQQKVINLVELTNYPYADDRDELEYSVLAPAPMGFSQQLDGQLLTITANEDAQKGSATALGIGVRDAAATGAVGRIELNVVASTRPLASPAADNATSRRGETTLIDVLDNDEATNPFPAEPLRVVQVTGTGSSLPDGVTIGVSEDNSRISVTVADSAEPADINLQYQVADATNDPDRFAWGVVHVSIQDVPDLPGQPVRQSNGFVAGELVLRFVQPQPNNSPITNYRVTSASHGGYSHDCGTTLICSIPGLTVGAFYTFQVTATNTVGDSEPSPQSDSYSVDYLPAAPASVTASPSSAAAAPAGGSIDISWASVPNPNPGSPLVGYTVHVAGVVTQQLPAGATSTTIAGLANDVTYTVSVHARNSAQVTAESDWNQQSTSVHTVGPPTQPNPAPQAASEPDGDIVVTWGTSGPNGGAPVSYDVARVDGSATAANCSSVSPIATGVTSPWTDTSSVDGATYTYFVYASNGSYCTVASSGATVSLVAPGQASGSATVENRGTGQFDVRAGVVSASGTVFKYQYLLSSDGTWRDLPADAWLTTIGSAGANYGQSIDVSFRACRNESDSYCGTASAGTAVTPVNARVTSASCDAAAASPNPPLINEPANSAPVTVSYSVDYNIPIVPGVANWSGSFGWNQADDVPSGAAGMRVRATVNGYQDPAFGEFACSQ